jgi:hypothetical protein
VITQGDDTMKSILIAALLLASIPAQAGKLAEGFRGIPFGDAAPLATAPMDGCSPKPEPSVEWNCSTTIGDVPVTVAYMVQEGLFTGVFIITEDFGNADTLFKTLQAAWGKGRKTNDWQDGSLPDWSWSDGGVYGSFRYNEYSNKASVIAFDARLSAKADAIKAEKAKSGAGDL